MTLDAFEYALSVNGKRDSRHHIAHLHVVDPADYDRFRTLNVSQFSVIMGYLGGYLYD